MQSQVFLSMMNDVFIESLIAKYGKKGSAGMADAQW